MEYGSGEENIGVQEEFTLKRSATGEVIGPMITLS